jgi:hypothetical protein
MVWDVSATPDVFLSPGPDERCEERLVLAERSAAGKRLLADRGYDATGPPSP